MSDHWRFLFAHTSHEGVGVHMKACKRFLANLAYSKVAIKAVLMVRLRSGTMVTFPLKVPKSQKHNLFKYTYIFIYSYEYL